MWFYILCRNACLTTLWKTLESHASSPEKESSVSIWCLIDALLIKMDNCQSFSWIRLEISQPCENKYFRFSLRNNVWEMLYEVLLLNYHLAQTQWCVLFMLIFMADLIETIFSPCGICLKNLTVCPQSTILTPRSFDGSSW